MTPERSLPLYWLCVHHLHSFLFPAETGRLDPDDLEATTAAHHRVALLRRLASACPAYVAVDLACYGGVASTFPVPGNTVPTPPSERLVALRAAVAGAAPGVQAAARDAYPEWF